MLGNVVAQGFARNFIEFDYSTDYLEESYCLFGASCYFGLDESGHHIL